MQGVVFVSLHGATGQGMRFHLVPVIVGIAFACHRITRGVRGNRIFVTRRRSSRRIDSNVAVLVFLAEEPVALLVVDAGRQASPPAASIRPIVRQELPSL